MNGCTWDNGSVTSMSYANDSFDFVFDKACLDSILSQDGGTRLALAYLSQVCALLSMLYRFFLFVAHKFSFLCV